MIEISADDSDYEEVRRALTIDTERMTSSINDIPRPSDTHDGNSAELNVFDSRDGPVRNGAGMDWNALERSSGNWKGVPESDTLRNHTLLEVHPNPGGFHSTDAVTVTVTEATLSG